MNVAPGSIRTALDVADWRRRVSAIYGRVREVSATDPASAHAHWVRERDDLFAHHPATPLLPQDRADFRGLSVTPYDPAWRFDVVIEPGRDTRCLKVETGTDGVVPFELLGTVRLPGVGASLEAGASLEVWRLASYGGGLFLPIKDALAGVAGGTYGGGRYLLDTVKGADLGSGRSPAGLVLDLNFAYNPSCAYDPAWACPLAQAGNTVTVEVPVGERY